MISEAEDRLRGGVLVGAAVLVLVAGGWWWRAAAPAAGPVPTAAVQPRPVDRDPVRVGEELVAGHPRAAIQVRIGADGRVLEETVLPEVRQDPDIGLPWFTDTLWRDRFMLVPGRPAERRDSLPDGAAHLFQYRCSGPGALSIAIWRGRVPEHRQVRCDGGFAELELPEQAQPLRMDLAASGPGAIQVEAQLVAVP